MTVKNLTQVGMHRAMWVMLKRLGGKIVIPERQIESPNQDDAMKIQYDPATKVFVLSLHKVKDNVNISDIIVQGTN